MDAFVQQLSIRVAAGRKLSLWDGLGGDPAGLLNVDEAAAVRAACRAQLRQLCIAPPSSLSDDFAAFNRYMSPSLPEMLKPTDAAAARRAAHTDRASRANRASRASGAAGINTKRLFLGRHSP